MIMRLFVFAVLVILNIGTSLLSFGQTKETIDTLATATLPSMQVSLLTCGPGEELYSSFGHTAIRIKNSQENIDAVYNYGTFNFRDSLFYVKFTLGKLDYYLAKDYYADFVAGYHYEGRSVQEQVLNITQEDAQQLYRYLENNLLPQNKYYRYDFIHDNCATRVRDAFEQSLGTSFVWGDIIGNKKVSFRNVINDYLANNHWSRLGINILLGSNIDSAMSTHTAMFLPDFLFSSLATAKLSSQSVVKESSVIIEGNKPQSEWNGALILGIVVLVLAVIIYNVKSFYAFRIIFSRIVLAVMGLLGVLILFMWLGTEHQACNNNYNILWAVPTHIIIAFLTFTGKSWIRLYAMASISLLIVAILVHILGIQVMPLFELLPWFMVLMLIYMDMYRRSLIANSSANS